MRELKVEDALYYLDTVKQEFGDRPHIYNEFLDIMKKFKSQEIDTPGVIRRVSTLFHGNRRLVLGFNTFLPEGYKIELPTDENGQAYAVYRTPGQPGVTQVLGPNNTRQIISSSASSSAPQQAQVHLSQPSAAAAAIPSTQKQSINQHAQMVQQQGGRPNQNFGMQSAPTGSMAQNQMQGMSQNANTIIQRSGAMALNMDGVNMNSFVPSRHLQQQPPPPPSLAAQSSHHSSSGPVGQYAQQGQITGVNNFGNQVEGIPSITHPLQQSRMGTGLQQQQHTTSIDAMQPASNVPQTNQQHPAEFDHAINYVTTIKKRFAKEPQTYKKFLDILHTYQKQQRGIKEVLDDVSTLFAEHPDLLTDFTYFLPDAVQEQAKLQLEQVAKAAEARKMAQSAKQAIMAQASMQRPHSSVTQTIQAPVQPSQPFSLGPGLTVHSNKLIASEAAPNPIPFGATKGRPEDREREICRSSIYGFVSFDPTRPPRRNELNPAQAAQKNGRPRMIPIQPVQPTTKESAFFEKARHHLSRKELAPDKQPGSRRHTPHAEFLKCLHLFAIGILSREDLLLLLRGLFSYGHAPKAGSNGGSSHSSVAKTASELIKEFEELLTERGPYADSLRLKKEMSKYGSLTIRQYDFSNCDHPTPSYQTYPADYPYDDFHIHSGRTIADASVLNDTLVCIGHGRTGPRTKARLLHSPEDYNGIKIRRNQYEDALAKIEDERFEVNIAIERNFSAMRQVESLAEEVSMLKENEEKDGQPIGRLQYKLRPRSLQSNHIGAIARLYGEYGDEVIRHLLKTPLTVLPIVFKRLKEKDAEWRKARTELTQKHWRQATMVNYDGSLDVLCPFYRRELERTFTPDSLSDECKRAGFFLKNPQKHRRHPAIDPFTSRFLPSHEEHCFMMFNPCILVQVSKEMPHKDAFDLLSFMCTRPMENNDDIWSSLSTLATEFLIPFFHISPHLFLQHLSRNVQKSLTRYADGEKVRTLYGDGYVMSVHSSSSDLRFYKVKLDFGVAFLRSDAVVHRLPSEYIDHDNAEDDDVRHGVYSCDTVNSDQTIASFFATESIYLFLRLYCLLVHILSRVKECIEMGVAEQQTDFSGLFSSVQSMEIANTAHGKKRAFNDILNGIKDYIKGEVDSKTLETRCRALSRTSVYLATTVPKLLETLHQSFSTVCQEGLLIPLFDYCMQRSMDVVELRAKSLELAPSASYRILYETNKASLYFCFVPKNMDMSASTSHPLGDTMMPMDVDPETEDKKLSAERSASRSSDESSSVKRQKVK